MFGLRTRAFRGFTVLATACGLATTAQAQFFPGINPCNPCAQPVAMAPVIQSAAVCDCPCMRPVTETVYREVDQVDYRPVQKTVKVAKVQTVMEERPVTTYQQVMEPRTAEVTSFVNQTVTECQQVTSNQSFWRTAWQPVQKVSPCQYDSRPGLLGEFNRMGIAMRNSFTPNYTARREFVPNVVAMQVPVQRTVQIPTTQTVTYNVARTVPVTTTQQVPVQRTVWEDQTVTAYEPYTTRKTVAVGTRTRMAYVDPTGAPTTSASLEPTPHAANPNGTRSADSKGQTKLQSAPSSQPAPIQYPTHRQNVQPEPVREVPTAAAPIPADSVIRVAGWRATRRPDADARATVPELKLVQK